MQRAACGWPSRLEEVRSACGKEMLGNTLVTIQTGPEAGKQVNRLYITDGVGY